MEQSLVYILAAVTLVSLVSIVGIVLFLRKKLLNRILFFLVSFAAGSLLGAAFLDLLPESLQSGFNEHVPLFTIAGILSFFILEKFLHWHHHHAEHKHEEVHAFTYLNLMGDAVHNFIDGAVIAVSFLHSTSLGIVTTIAIIAHEIPQEIGDFAVLIYGGFSRAKALLYNFLTALTAIIGALVAYFYSGLFEEAAAYITAFAAGGFIYIAGTDLIPELQKEKNIKKSFVQFALLILGVAVIWIVARIFEGH
ncbi:MAG TPA: ZIP family metal transporter [Candidatus Nanoarchaeia archaeon]|nr:ZIP family metal transporter [Candidatus Nanoarchaeia archaeon]